MKIKCPIIVSASGELFLFDSLQSLTAWLDPMEVIRGTYSAYDGDAATLCLLTTKQEGQPGYGVAGDDEVRVEVVDKMQQDEGVIRQLFLDYFDKMDLGGAINRQASLENLLKLFVISYGYTR